MRACTCMQAGAYVCVCYYCYNYYHHDNHYSLYDSFLGSFDDRELQHSIIGLSRCMFVLSCVCASMTRCHVCTHAFVCAVGGGVRASARFAHAEASPKKLHFTASMS